MIIPLIIYIILYITDMLCSVYLLKKNNPQFINYESNDIFKKMVCTYGIKKGMLVYTLSAGVQLLFINVISFIFAFRFISGEWNITLSLGILFSFMALVHCFGILSNLVALLKTNGGKNETKTNQ